jgi:AraC-like DNA-binding protein
MDDLDLLERIFDLLPDVVFFTKDREARYLRVNQTLLDRCRIADRRQILGRTAAEVFPAPLGARYMAQDLLVLRTGVEVRDKLELHLYPGGEVGWCLTFKTPLPGRPGRAAGLVGFSRDLFRPDESHPDYRRLAEAVEHLRAHYDEPLRLAALGRRFGLSQDKLERLVKEVFHVTPRQLLTKTRIDAASRLLLETRRSVAEVAHACGYSDHSAFTRQFRATVGLTPREFRLTRSEARG